MSDSNLRPGGDVGIFLSLWDQLTCLDPVWTLCGPCVDPVWTLSLIEPYIVLLFIHFRLKHL